MRLYKVFVLNPWASSYDENSCHISVNDVLISAWIKAIVATCQAVGVYGIDFQSSVWFTKESWKIPQNWFSMEFWVFCGLVRNRNFFCEILVGI